MHITDHFLKERMIEAACVNETEYVIAKELLKTRRQVRFLKTQKITAYAIASVLLLLLGILFVYAIKYRAGVC